MLFRGRGERVASGRFLYYFHVDYLDLMRTGKKILVLLLLALLFSPADAQRILLLEKPGTFRNYKYFPGDEIVVRTAPAGMKHGGTINGITDTSILINYDEEILIEDIEKVLRHRWALGLTSKATRIAGAGYFALDVVNNAINHELVVDKNTVMISAGLVAFSYALVPLHYKKMNIGEKWRIKVLNMSMDEEVVTPFLR